MTFKERKRNTQMSETRGMQSPIGWDWHGEGPQGICTRIGAKGIGTWVLCLSKDKIRMEKLEPSCIASGNGKWWDTVWQFLKMLNVELPYYPANKSIYLYLYR